MAESDYFASKANFDATLIGVGVNPDFFKDEWIEALEGEQHAVGGDVPILVGGTGLYFKALLEGLSPVPDIPAEVRTFWRDQAKLLGPEGLHVLLVCPGPIRRDNPRLYPLEGLEDIPEHARRPGAVRSPTACRR